MEKTLKSFKDKQSNLTGVLKKLQNFLLEGVKVGVEIDPSLITKVKNSIDLLSNEKLKVALIGGFSEGKTSIAAAWIENLDKSSMNISQKESSNEVKVYELGNDIILIDTPGLFGYKEQYNSDTHSVEKYKDITKKYVSESHLVLYVMNSTNPIKESHRDDLNWLFRTLNLLPRTVFVLSRFDEVADVEDEAEYLKNLEIKKKSVVERLKDLINITESEAKALDIVAVAANPFDQGFDYWLNNLSRYRQLSHISLLQDATSKKISMNGGLVSIVKEVQASVIKDVLTKQLPIAISNDQQIGFEVTKLQAANIRLADQLKLVDSQAADTRISLRSFVTNYFTDLILQAKSTSIETFSSFFEREIGDEGIVLKSRIQNEFDRRIGNITLELDQMNFEFEAEERRFNGAMLALSHQGLKALSKSNTINAGTIKLTRDATVSVANFVGLDLSKILKFKPWGAVKLAGGINKALPFIGIALEVWDSYDKASKEEKFKCSINEIVSNLGQQRSDLLGTINSDSFNEYFFPELSDISRKSISLNEILLEREQLRARFSNFRQMGEVIDAEFTELY